MTSNSVQDKLNLLELVGKTGNVAEACRASGFSRDSYYRFKKLYNSHGVDGLKKSNRKKALLKNRISKKIEAAVIDYSLKDTLQSSVSISQSLKEKGITVSSGGVRNIWVRNNMETIQKRFEALERIALIDESELSQEQIKTLIEKKYAYTDKPPLKVRYPGQACIFTMKHICTSKLLGKVFQFT